MKTELHDFEISILNYWDNPYFSRCVRAESAGAAKYNYWLKYRDAYGDMTFGEFLKITKCRKVG